MRCGGSAGARRVSNTAGDATVPPWALRAGRPAGRKDVPPGAQALFADGRCVITGCLHVPRPLGTGDGRLDRGPRQCAMALSGWWCGSLMPCLGGQVPWPLLGRTCHTHPSGPGATPSARAAPFLTRSSGKCPPTPRGRQSVLQGEGAKTWGGTLESSPAGGGSAGAGGAGEDTRLAWARCSCAELLNCRTAGMRIAKCPRGPCASRQAARPGRRGSGVEGSVAMSLSPRQGACFFHAARACACQWFPVERAHEAELVRQAGEQDDYPGNDALGVREVVPGRGGAGWRTRAVDSGPRVICGGRHRNHTALSAGR